MLFGFGSEIVLKVDRLNYFSIKVSRFIYRHFELNIKSPRREGNKELKVKGERIKDPIYFT